MIKVHAVGYYVEKAGNSRDQYEDASRLDLSTGRFAVADGASSAYDSKNWARLLVDKFVKSPPELDGSDLNQWLEGPSLDWTSNISWDELPYYKYNKAQEGAFATFLGVQLNTSLDDNAESQLLHWHALAVGDSAIIVVRNDRLLTSFPVTLDTVFDNRPALISTNAAYNKQSLKKVVVQHGDLKQGDLMFLVTDAMAEWLLESIRRGEKPWIDLAGIQDDDQFALMVQRLRTEGKMKNDDTTLIILRVMASTARLPAKREAIRKNDQQARSINKNRLGFDLGLLAITVVIMLCVAIAAISVFIGTLLVITQIIQRQIMPSL